MTKRGHGYTARMAASLLNSIELPELITDSEQAYEALAIDLATNPVRMAAVKPSWRQTAGPHRCSTPNCLRVISRKATSKPMIAILRVKHLMSLR